MSFLNKENLDHLNSKNNTKSHGASSEVDYGLKKGQYSGQSEIMSGLETEKTFGGDYFNSAKYDEGAIPDWLPIPLDWRTHENIRRFAIILMIFSSFVFSLFVSMIQYAVNLGFESNEILVFRSAIQLIFTIGIMKIRGDNYQPHYNTLPYIVCC